MSGFGRIVSTVSVESPLLASEEAAASIRSGADRAEIRIDAFADPVNASSLTGLAGKLPLVFSGNRVSLAPGEEIILREASSRGAWIDIPFEEGRPLPAWVDRNRTVLSCHRRLESFSELRSLFSSMKESARIVKIVCPVRDIGEAAGFTEWTRELDSAGSLIAFPSGIESGPARLIALASGSAAVYAASPGSPPAAEGQMKLGELMRFDPVGITGDTSFYGLLGHPLEFSLSPGLWNSWFRRLGMNSRFLLFPSSSPEAALEAFSMWSVPGFGVTAPFKEKIMGRLDSICNTAKRCGAVNTVKSDGGKLLGANTDVYGIRRSLSGINKGLRVLILGSGGAARAALSVMKNSHRALLSARSPEKGRRTADEFGAVFVEWGRKHEGVYDMVINATSCGADGKEMPWERDRRLGAKVLFEMVTRGERTPLERKAEKEGLSVIPGATMLAHQARLQFRMLTGVKPPKE